MFFETMKDLKLWLKICKKYNFDGGSQGECYRIGNKVYKIFIQFIEEDIDDMIVYDKEDILKFSSIINNTFIFPNDVIIVGDIVVGYVTDYVDAISLYKTDPLKIELKKFQEDLDWANKDIEIISNNGILSFDVAYNILYGSCGLKVIDTMEYPKTDIDSLKLFKVNRERFYYEIRLFLLDGYFDEFMKTNPDLYNMCYDPEVDFNLFLTEFIKRLSENEGYEILKLGDAKRSLVRTKYRDCKYIRGFDE